MNIFLLLILIFAVAISAMQAFVFAQQQKVPPFLATFIWSAFVVFIGSLIPGALGCYTPIPVTFTTVSVAVLSLLFLWRVAHVPFQFPRISLDLGGDLFKGPWNLVTVAVSVISALLLWPYVECFAKAGQLLVSPQGHLGWDTVSYHLPGLIEFIQAHSLWSFEGPYQSYSYGFELIYGLSILFCHSHWGVIIGHGFSVVLLLLSAAYITQQLINAMRRCGIDGVNALMVHLLVQAIWAGTIFNTSLDGVGNNDVFEAATILSSFGFFLALATDSNGSVARRNALLFLGGMSFSMALATKSPALAFTPLFALMASSISSDNKLGISVSLKEIRRALPVFVGAGLLGSFFLWHNFAGFGGICDPALAIGFRDTLLHHLRDPKMLKPTVGSVMFLASAATLILIGKLWTLCRPSEHRKEASGLLWLAALYITGMAAFSYTPFGVTPNYDVNDLTTLFWQHRKAMVMYMATAIALALSIAVLCAKLVRLPSFSIPWFASSNPAADSRRLVLSPYLVPVVMCCFLLLIPALNWWWHREWPLGLNGYETVKGLPQTKVYRWVQSLDSGTRIYSSGLRPYGLFGKDYNNKLFYDLHSHILKKEGESRLLAVLDQFHPDLILISVDPHAYTGDAHKPEIVEWMKREPCFTQVYEDETVSGFRVGDGWQSLLEKYKLPDPPVRMHS